MLYKNFRVWENDHKKLKIESAQKEKAMIEEFSEIMNSPVRIIDGKRYRVVPMESDSLTGGNVRPAKMARSNRVGKDG